MLLFFLLSFPDAGIASNCSGLLVLREERRGGGCWLTFPDAGLAMNLVGAFVCLLERRVLSAGGDDSTSPSSPLLSRMLSGAFSTPLRIGNRSFTVCAMGLPLASFDIAPLLLFT